MICVKEAIHKMKIVLILIILFLGSCSSIRESAGVNRKSIDEYSVIENPSHIYDDPGVYDVILIVKDINECADSITKHIIMYYDFILHVPTAFTPNDDGDNDLFGPQGLRMEKYESYAFYIYNQWGERIFETEDINEWWTGADFPAEVYSWLLIITDELGRVRKENGLVTLIK
jgi:gliding motility-associated-like protein